MQGFGKVEALFKKEIRAVLAERTGPALSEAAFPAYAHRNPLIEYVFWKRLRVAYEYCTGRNARRALDFGCGPGILCYALARVDVTVVGLDTDLSPLSLLRPRIDFPETIRFLEADLLESDLEPGSFDLIFALDVLEHIPDLQPYLDRFAELLAPGGRILVSVPTESFFYRIGRKLAGRQFSGDYHCSGAAAVRRALERDFAIEPVATLVRPVPLFEIFSARPRGA